MSLWTMLGRAGRLHPDALAVVDGGRRLSYRAMGSRTEALALHLRQRGMAPGERVAILAPNSLAFLEGYFAAAGLGAISVPLNPRLHPDELVSSLADCGAVAIVVDPSLASVATEILPRSPQVRVIVFAGDAFPLPTPLAVDAYAFTPDGWLRTGDLAVVDQEGYLTIVDRKKDTMKMAFKLPRQVRFLAEPPKTGSGKILKRALAR